ELSGRSYDQFFDQWVYHAHHPELELSYSWDEGAKLAKLSVRQTQKLSENILLFDLPLTIRFKTQSGAVNRPLHITAKEEDFYFSLDSAPQIVRFDPDYTLLAKISFKVPSPMLSAQLAAKPDGIGRVLALEHLSSRRAPE